MKIIKFKFLVFILALTGLVAACTVDDGDNYCFQQGAVATRTVTGPSETTVNTPITLNVSFTPLGTCGQFNRFVETNTFPKDIRILVDYVGCECPPTDEIFTEAYVFNATAPGEYVLRFLTADEDSPVLKTITVTE